MSACVPLCAHVEGVPCACEHEEAEESRQKHLAALCMELWGGLHVRDVACVYVCVCVCVKEDGDTCECECEYVSVCVKGNYHMGQYAWENVVPVLQE
jgi:hypothetical protein